MFKFYSDMWWNFADRNLPNSVGRLNRIGYLGAIGITTLVILLFFARYPLSSEGLSELSGGRIEFWRELVIFFLCIPSVFATAGRVNDIGINGYWTILLYVMNVLPFKPLKFVISIIALGIFIAPSDSFQRRNSNSSFDLSR